MESSVAKMRTAVDAVARLVDQETYAVIPTSRDLQALVNKRFERQANAYRWYAVISRGDHIYAVADIGGSRISLQRFVLRLQNPDITYAEVKQVSFVNKVSLDCRLSNLEDRIGRQAVMRNRRTKRNTSSKYKGVNKTISSDGSTRWRAQIQGNQGNIYIGTYVDEHWAAMMYDAAAYLLFEGAAHFNLPECCPNLDALQVVAPKIAKYHAKLRQADGG